MSIRKSVKRLLYRYVPGFSGAFPYFGTRVFFQPNANIWDLVCQQGIYEQGLLTQILASIQPGSWYFDVGANFGLMSVPVLRSISDVRVASFEPSRNSRGYLKQTWENSPFRDRWKLINKAVSECVGEATFTLSVPSHGDYDGLKHTDRVESASTETVETTTLDVEWNSLGRPPVSCIKLDIEGAEMFACRGARELITAHRPYIFLEWYEKNFRHFGVKGGDLLELAGEHGYDVLNVDSLAVIESPAILAMHMRTTASFALVPKVANPARLP